MVHKRTAACSQDQNIDVGHTAMLDLLTHLLQYFHYTVHGNTAHNCMGINDVLLW